MIEAGLGPEAGVCSQIATSLLLHQQPEHRYTSNPGDRRTLAICTLAICACPMSVGGLSRLRWVPVLLLLLASCDVCLSYVCLLAMCACPISILGAD